MDKVQTALMRLARADMVFFIMPPLMVLLVVGTITQRWMGLYAAHQKFFASFIFWVGPEGFEVVPLPGGYLLLGILSLSLTLKFILGSVWNWRKAGIILTHLGALILLVGGLLTALSAEERYMIIPEGGQSAFMYDYIDRELSIYSDDDVKLKAPFEALRPGKLLSALPFELKILSICENCGIKKRAELADEFGERPLHGMAKFMALNAQEKEKDPEENISGVVFEVSGVDNEAQNGIYLAIEGMPAPVSITHDASTYEIILGKAQETLPFSIILKDFNKDTYPGTDKARGFSSDIVLQDGTLEWPARIEMNKPLRYKGYTFFQSSFERGPGGEISIFSVVKNHGRLMPYIGTLILSIGLLLHIMSVLRRHDRERTT